MMFRRETLARIQTGEITSAFRKWRRPSVKSGGTLKTSIGLLSIDSVERVSALKELNERPEGEAFRICFRLVGPDPRIELRQRKDLTEDEWRDLEQRLERLDRASRTGPWTEEVLDLIARNAGVRSGDLAPEVGQQQKKFKLNVRKLKNLGLTESLEVGYRLSPLGRALLERLK
jgi:hypothetical protein